MLVNKNEKKTRLKKKDQFYNIKLLFRYIIIKYIINKYNTYIEFINSIEVSDMILFPTA